VSALDPALARRLDRLARHAHGFHRFAHHPLCDSYEGEVLRLGRRTRLCRGCSWAAVGATLGTGVGVVLPPSLGFAAACAGLFALALAPTFTPLRLPKLATRALPAGASLAAVAIAMRAQTAASMAVALAVAVALVAAWLGYRRRGPNRDACAACPQREGARACAGFAPIARRERAFQRLASRWIAAARSELH
jgi:hypothetical protein